MIMATFMKTGKQTGGLSHNSMNFSYLVIFSILFATFKFKACLETETLYSDDGIDRFLFVFREQGNIIGSASLAHDIKTRICLLSYLNVNPECRQRGIGSNLLKEAIQKARQLNVPMKIIAKPNFEVQSNSDLDKLILFYQKNGAEVERKYPTFAIMYVNI